MTIRSRLLLPDEDGHITSGLVLVVGAGSLSVAVEDSLVRLVCIVAVVLGLVLIRVGLIPMRAQPKKRRLGSDFGKRFWGIPIPSKGK